jgi:hypothetical protein
VRLGEWDHGLLALSAADCAERVLPCFEVGRAWARGEIATGEARAAAFGPHAAVPTDSAAAEEERAWQY